MFEKKLEIRNLLNFSWCTEGLSLNMADANDATAGKKSYVGTSTERKVFRVTAAYNYSTFQSNELSLQKVIYPSFICRLLQFTSVLTLGKSFLLSVT